MMQQRAEVTPKPDRIKTAEEFLRSGMTMVAWSKERQMNRFTLHNWVDEYRHEAKPDAGGRDWLEVRASTTAEVIAVAAKGIAMKPESELYTPIRITIANTQIEVTSAFDENALAAVIKAVTCQ